ncbi:alpha/beta fold hydrolase [Secundilactobacillus kimchicus]|uniref:alpha/beta fold hydrolase n=1 Tax=Secundilactobacillus kimchicus TaxID=528209 RepID=UPI0027956B25|nr:alpha/beta fold hydrolase [Secundilactobacillus kimchicus]
MKFKGSDHVIIDYSDVGEGQAVVLLCGLGGEKEIWFSQEQFLLGQGYRVINLDARNQGYSSRTPLKAVESFAMLKICKSYSCL